MKKLAAVASVTLLFALGACNGDKKDDVDVNPGKGNDVCQGNSCGDEKGDDR